ncbi:NfeD family protein [Halonotius terrestris]|uniref:NfeD family protein n=1 Tax=Halonotius terrestris TaxID=2487750 RepID=A0A8J8TDH3_9EURY|nr:NfeD family protein [Halonotius terrestris]TQQ83531.1 NfeD family protein [Halonotius terrestris]
MSLLISSLVSPETLPLLLVTAGLLISLAEALAPGANFIVAGVGLLGAGLVGLAFPFLGPFALGLFVLLFGILAFYVYHEFDIYGGKGQAQTSNSDTLQGMTGRVTEEVTPTGGEVKLQGGGFNPFYSARSMEGEIPEGTDVMVIDPGGGNVVTVESLETIEDDIDRELAAGREAAQDESAAAAFADEHPEVDPAEIDAAEADHDREVELEKEVDRDR